ncbi:leucine efflux protein LeuE [Morganella psychrotolerans]|uniref:Leucine efflux protein LeuE n=1 Tax=Morganella psychrotolerans TaxID=368603 RepID=A0A5M9RDU0_9GAMM|nr:leucine efflux protein LeuE [Morganella psychrotolerans]KAA8717635.1 leucine efflux protein LeuE [Morganella psychrotolerans]HCM62417.1 leucine efflux protein LeuE [Morganella sp. (in: enterobacteria)]
MFEQLGILNIGTYLIGAIFIILVPGPNSLYVLKSSATFGYKKGYQAAFGVFVGDAVLVFLSFLGVASVIKASPVLFTAVRYLGAAYLLYLGLKILYATFIQKQSDHDDKPLRAENAFNKALILSLTNPKAILFYVSFFIQFIDFNYAHPGISYAVLALLLEAISFIYLSFLIYSGAKLSQFFRHKKQVAKAGNSTIGLFFMGFAAKLALFTA